MATINVWEFVEMKMKCIVPMYLRNLLAREGFECITTIKNIVDDDVAHLEMFAKSDEYARKIPKDADLEQFYGSFHDAIDRFEILRGHKVLLREIAKYFSKESTERDFAVFEDQRIVNVSNQQNDRATPKDVQPKATISNGSLDIDEDGMESTIKSDSKKKQVKITEAKVNLRKRGRPPTFGKKEESESNKRARLKAETGTDKSQTVDDTKQIAKPENLRLTKWLSYNDEPAKPKKSTVSGKGRGRPKLLSNNDDKPAKPKKSTVSGKGRGRPKLLSNNDDEPVKPNKSPASGKGHTIPTLLSNDEKLAEPKKSLATSKSHKLMKLLANDGKLAKPTKSTASTGGRGRPKSLSNNKEPTQLLSNNEEPTQLLSNNEEPTQLLSNNEEPTKLLSNNEEPTKLLSNNEEPTKLLSNNEEPTEPEFHETRMYPQPWA